MWAAIIGFVAWAIGFVFKPASRDAELKKSGATEVQKDEALNVVQKVQEADLIRDGVRDKSSDELQHDAGNLYRD